MNAAIMIRYRALFIRQEVHSHAPAQNFFRRQVAWLPKPMESDMILFGADRQGCKRP